MVQKPCSTVTAQEDRIGSQWGAHEADSSVLVKEVGASDRDWVVDVGVLEAQIVAGVVQIAFSMLCESRWTVREAGFKERSNLL